MGVIETFNQTKIHVANQMKRLLQINDALFSLVVKDDDTGHISKDRCEV